MTWRVKHLFYSVGSFLFIFLFGFTLYFAYICTAKSIFNDYMDDYHAENFNY